MRPQKSTVCSSWAIRNRRRGKFDLALKEENFLCSFEKEENPIQIVEPFNLLARIDATQLMLLYCPGRVYDIFKYSTIQDALFYECETKTLIPIEAFNRVIDDEIFPKLDKLVFLWSSSTKSGDTIGAMMSKLPESVVISHPKDFTQLIIAKDQMDALVFEKLQQNILKFQIIQVFKRYPGTSVITYVCHYSNIWYVEKIPAQIQPITAHFIFDDDRNLPTFAEESDRCVVSKIKGLQDAVRSKTTLKQESTAIEMAISRNSANHEVINYLEKVMVLLLFKEYSNSNNLQDKLFAITAQDLKNPKSTLEYVVNKMQTQPKVEDLTDYAKREIDQIALKFVHDQKETALHSGGNSSQVWEQFDEIRAQFAQIIPCNLT